MAARFARPVSDSAELELCATAVPTSTKAATNWGIWVWSDWANSRDADQQASSVLPVTTPLLELTPESLAYWLGKFVLEVRKQGGTQYPPKTYML